MLTAKIIFVLVVGGGLLFLVNWPIFQWVDSLFYGSSEAAAEAIREGQAHERAVRSEENSNVFNQVESFLSTGHSYRSDYQRSWTVGEYVKAGIVIIELMVIGSWFLK